MRESVDSPGNSRVTGEQRMSHTASGTVRQSCGRLQWHVAATLPDRQFTAETALAAAGWRVLNPLHVHRTLRHPDKIVPLWPGYLLVGCPDGADWTEINRTRGVLQLLMSEPGKPGTVPGEAVGALRARMSARRVVDDPLTANAVYAPGSRLIVADGPLAGLEGICERTAEGRVHVLLSLLGREFAHALPVQSVMPARD